MVNDIIIGICEKLKETFGDSYGMHSDTIADEWQKPCFVIACLSSESKQLLGKRCLRKHTFSIKYLAGDGADTPGAQAECFAVQETLFAALEYINVGGDLARGKGMVGMFTDNALDFTVAYEFFILVIDETEQMEKHAVTFSN